MKNVYGNLFVGSGEDFEKLKNEPDWFFVQAAKEPWHRQALGYTGRSAPKEHKEYLIAERASHLILNMVDTDSPDYFSAGMFKRAMAFIDAALAGDKKVLVHCNQGESRGPSLALTYLASIGILGNSSAKQAVQQFVTLYPSYNPKAGVAKFLEKEWENLFK